MEARYAGLPHGGRKTDPANASLYARADRSKSTSVYPIQAWYRNQRGAIRAIFMDSVWNVGLVARTASTVRSWLRDKYPEFDVWRNHAHSLNPSITRALTGRGYFFEGDVKAMDMGMSWEVVSQIVLPVVYAPVLSKTAYEKFYSAVWQLYHAPVLWGDRILTGKHATLSGLGFVTDFETILTCVIQLLAASRVGVRLPFFRQGGDDALAYLQCLSAAEEFQAAYIQVAGEL